MSPPPREEELPRREREILKAIVEEFISTGEPVGSNVIAPRYELSSATVRSAMADLEALGYLGKPHTSAGRIPTDKGFRLYVDGLVRVRTPGARDRGRIERSVQPAPLADLMAGAGKLLHQLTRHASVVVAPALEQAIFRRIEFVRLREDRVLAIFVTQAGLVHNRLITVDFPLLPGELEHATNLLNELLRELSLDQIQQRIRAEKMAEQALYDELHRKTLTLADRAFDDPGLPRPPPVLVEGEASFLDEPSFAEDVEKMRNLFASLAQKDRLLVVLQRALEGREIKIFIGAESELSGLADVSLVAAPYTQGDQILGALAVIGPTRMNYAHVIPVVDYTARAISRTLGAV
ncbi:heat-inducible transcriptional repressor HrcA [Vulgatibacter incomptus]|uniref:Heat-inducible transcription repressor HrcA n=1 Tax=Vulgatibacter incomptus TaxID=1391653 RepID=A0A0K1PH23_9BACT|nr:heat-inducible transcriptional repressor HrcA [Vulgatibacter incomptus]AKU92820.1 Heat-inducible transcription repressor HrcA [Vulgatibacter incomptus]